MEHRRALRGRSVRRRHIFGAGVVALLALVGVATADVAKPGYVLWAMNTQSGQLRANAEMSLDSESDRLLARSATDRLAVATSGGLLLENADGSARVLVPTSGQPASASFSPSGAAVAFTTATCGNGNPLCSRLLVVNSSGSNSRLLARDTSEPSWTPNGKAVVYVGDIGWSGIAFGKLTVRPLSGGTPQILGPAIPGFLAFSPDSRSIAYDCPTSGVCVMNLESKHVTNLGAVTKQPVVASQYILWSSDSRRIAVNTSTDANFGLIVVNLQTHAAQVLSGVYWRGEVASPLAWSPDSKTLLWGYRFKKVRIFETNVVSRHRTRVSRNDRLWYFARWTRKGITFVTYTGRYQPTY